MATETLAIPEERLGVVIDWIWQHLGPPLEAQDIEALRVWCVQETRYLRDTMSPEFWPYLIDAILGGPDAR